MEKVVKGCPFANSGRKCDSTCGVYNEARKCCSFITIADQLVEIDTSMSLRE